MACCGGQQGPIKSSLAINKLKTGKTVLKDESQRLAYCSACGSIIMLIIVSGRERMQCTNHECRKIQK